MRIKANFEILPQPTGDINTRYYGDNQRLREKCREFEAVLLQQMVEVMQGSSEFFGKGVQGEFLRGIFAEEMAKELAKDPGLGLAESIYRALAVNDDTH